MALTTESENALSSGMDLKERKVFFGRYLPNADVELGNHFDQISVEYTIRQIHRLISDSKKPVEIHMNSYGGDPYAMLYIHDLILASPVQFKFYGGGAIMSAATWVMAVCDERYLYKNTTIMVHNGNMSADGNLTDVEIRIEEEKRLQSLLEEIYAANSRMPKSFWSEICKRDLYLTADEVILLGLADKIIEPKKRGSFRKMRIARLAETVHHNKMKRLVSKMFDRIQIPRLSEITLNIPSQDGINIIDETVNEETKEIQNDSTNQSERRVEPRGDGTTKN